MNVGPDSAYSADSAAVQWDTPTPLGKPTDLPAFPLDVFPNWLADMVSRTAIFTQTDPGMAGAVALGVLATCTGGRLVVQVKPGWREPTNLFVAVVAKPGERKSPVYTALTGPLRAVEQSMMEDSQDHIHEVEALKEIANLEATKAKQEAAKPSKNSPRSAAELKQAAIAAALAAEAITVPVAPRLFADDVTPEKLGLLLEEHGGRMAVLSDEGGVFDILAGRYSSQPNLDPFLKGHAGSPLRVDRMGRNAVYVQHPALTVCLMMQPGVLADVGGNGRMVGRGLLARFLLVMAPSKVGSRMVDPDPVPEAVRALYTERVVGLARILTEWTDPAVVMLDPEAYAVLLKYHQRVEDDLAPGAALSHVADWGNKLYGAVARLAGVLHAAHNPSDAFRGVITAETMRAAVRLADFFTAHYKAAVESIGADPALEAARYVRDVIGRMDVKEFTERELFNKISRSKVPTMAALRASLATLREYGWIEPMPEQEHVGPGRKPSPGWYLHPALTAAENAQYAEWL